MSKTIWIVLLTCFATVAFLPVAKGDNPDQLIDYKAALSQYVQQVSAEDNVASQLAQPRLVTRVAQPPLGGAFQVAPAASYTAAAQASATTAGARELATSSVPTVSGTFVPNGNAENRHQGDLPVDAQPLPVDPALIEATSCEPGTYYVDEATVCSGCCSSLCGCRPCASPFWLRGELLLWGVEGQNVPPLLTRSPAGTPTADLGVLGLPTTRTLYGNEEIGDGLRAGLRIRGGRWFDPCRKWGLEGDFIFLGDDDDHITASSASGELFARPFYNTNPAINANDAEFLVGPGIGSSVFDINTSSEIYSAAATLRWNLYCCEGANCCCESTSTRVDLLAGYRYFRFAESIETYERFAPNGPFYAPGTFYEFHDQFDVENDFHGGEFGLSYLAQRSRWVLEMTSRIALGNVRTLCHVDGYSRAVVPGVLDQTVPGGFLTAGSALGTFKRNEFGVLPQAEVVLGYCLTPQLRLHLGYNFLYLNRLVRPGSLIPTAIDSDDFLTATAATDSGPDKDRIDEGVWLQGINLGFTLNF